MFMFDVYNSDEQRIYRSLQVWTSQAFLLNIAIYIAIQVASGLIYALAGIVKAGGS